MSNDEVGDHRCDMGDQAQRESIIAAIREGLTDVEGGRTKPARAALLALARKYGMTLPGK